MTPYRRGLGKLFVAPLTGAIATELADARRLPNGRLGKFLQVFSHRELALMALEAVLPQVGRPLRRRDEESFERAIKEAIGEIFYANIRLRKAVLSDSEEYLRRTRWRRAALQGSLRARRGETLAEWRARLHKARVATWLSLIEGASRHDIVRAGAWLLERVVDANIVIWVDKQLVPTSECRGEIARLVAFILQRNEHLLPLPSRPAFWKAPEMEHGGVRRRLLSHWNKDLHAKVAESFGSLRFRRQHLAAVNLLGTVPLRIDEWTLKLVRDYATRVKQYKDDDHRAADAVRIENDVKVAARLLRRGVFHNSYHIDYRGRFNADQDFNYAQRDSVRSLFRFANGVPVGERGGDGLFWLAVHVANTHGEDKISYDDRVQWVRDNYDDIERVATNPRGSFDYWKEADKPFAFAAACHELVNAVDNPSLVTTLPTAHDHTASGIQHLALICLDAEVARLVNLTPRTAPSDIYGVLAKRARELFDSSSPGAFFWNELFNKHPRAVRKLLKAPGMTFSYASTSRGNINQLYDAYDEHIGGDLPEFKLMCYLVEHFRKACAELLPGPIRIMRFIHELVHECNKRNCFLEWPSPSGLLVSNNYPKLDPRRILLPDGSKPTLAEALYGTVDKKQAKNSAVANVIHSLDASHLARTTKALTRNHMPMLGVHDSYSVLAPHATQFHITNREELVLMYQEIFDAGGLLEQLCRYNNISGLTPPARGSIELLALVLQATYACS
jgi:hypothetical protein